MWPTNELDAQALKPAIAGLLNAIPFTWAEFDSDRMSARQSQALLLLTAAGMVDRRIRCRISFANHPVSFELRIQATGEAGYDQAMQSASAIQHETWRDAWAAWIKSDTREQSPFHTQPLKPEEWRLTDQGELAREELAGTSPGACPRGVLDFVLKRGLYGPGYWARRIISGQPITGDDAKILQTHQAAGRDLNELSRPSVVGSGMLIEIKKVDHSHVVQGVRLTNWGEGAQAFAESFDGMLGKYFEALSTPGSGGSYPPPPVDDARPDVDEAPVGAGSTLFDGGELVFFADRVTLCGTVICSGKRSRSQRVVLELLSRRSKDGEFTAYGSDKLAKEAAPLGAKGSPAGVVRGLRASISIALLERGGIECGPEDVILSGGEGYRLSPKLSVQFADPPLFVDIMDIGGTANVHDDHGHLDSSVHGSGPQARQQWILHQLRNGVRLNIQAVSKGTGKSRKTAQRDLDRLREQGKIEFVGDPRSGQFRLKSG
jgi:hypothetical protein